MKSKLFCPDCKSELSQKDSITICVTCGKQYKMDNEIIIFDTSISENTEKYWNEVPLSNIRENYLLDFLPKKIFENALDIGCGEGRATVVISEISKVVYGLDSSQHLLRSLSRKDIENSVLINGDAKKLPFPDDYFDLIISLSVIEHIPFKDTKYVFMEAERVLSPGGIFLIRNDAWFYGVLEKLRIRPGMIGVIPDVTHVNMMTGIKFKNVLEQAGLIVEHEHHFPFYRYPKKFTQLIPLVIQRIFATHSNFVCRKIN